MKIQFKNSETRSVMLVSTAGKGSRVIATVEPGSQTILESTVSLVVEMVAFEDNVEPLKLPPSIIEDDRFNSGRTLNMGRPPKPTEWVDRNGKVLRTFASQTEAAAFFGINPIEITRSVDQRRAVCGGKYRFRNVGDTHIPRDIAPGYQSGRRGIEPRPITEYRNNKPYKFYGSVNEAAKAHGVNSGTIAQFLKSGLPRKGSIFKYTNEKKIAS